MLNKNLNNFISITNILIVLNILVFTFISLKFSQTEQNIINLFYGLNNYNIYQGYTLFTPMFLHANLFHLVMNMLALYTIGNYLESRVSKKFYLFIYFMSGLIGSIFSIIFILFNLEVLTVVIGASGAIFGLYTVYAILRNELKSFYINVIFLHSMIFFLNLPIAWYSHLGGIVCGAIIAFYLKGKPRLKLS